MSGLSIDQLLELGWSHAGQFHLSHPMLKNEHNAVIPLMFTRTQASAIQKSCVLGPRMVVRATAIALERVLQENDHKGCWTNETFDQLLEKLYEERDEVDAEEAALSSADEPDAGIILRFRRELLDEMAVCMMLLDATATTPIGSGRRQASEEIKP